MSRERWGCLPTFIGSWFESGSREVCFVPFAFTILYGDTVAAP